MSETEKDIIELGEDDAALVITKEGLLTMHIPDKDYVGENAQLISALGCMLGDPDFLDYIWAWWADQVESIEDMEFDFEPEEF